MEFCHSSPRNQIHRGNDLAETDNGQGLNLRCILKLTPGGFAGLEMGGGADVLALRN